eukprot:2849998-Pyramimonas_sp.AAC.1
MHELRPRTQSKAATTPLPKTDEMTRRARRGARLRGPYARERRRTVIELWHRAVPPALLTLAP